MKDSIALRSPGVLHFRKGEETLYGPNQDWFEVEWQRKAGCGPTACSGALWYLAKTRPECSGLLDGDWRGRAGILSLMEQVWTYVTPGHMGVNRAEIVETGVRDYARGRGVEMSCDVLKVPTLGRRPALSRLSDFVNRSIAEDFPVVFLNLSNGGVAELDSWHWVLLIEYDAGSHKAIMFDQSRRRQIDLALWLKTTLLGGALVSIHNN